MIFKLISQSISSHFSYSVLVWCYLILCFHFSYFGSLYFYLSFVLLSLYFYFLCLVAVSIISLLLVTTCSEICVAKYCWSVFSHSPFLLLHLVFFLSFYCLLLFLMSLLLSSSHSTSFSYVTFYSDLFYCFPLSSLSSCFLWLSSFFFYSSTLFYSPLILTIDLFSLFVLYVLTAYPHSFPLSSFKLNFFSPLLHTKTCSVLSSSDW